MQIKNKKTLGIIILVVAIILILVVAVVLKGNDKEIKADYYYTFEYDENLVTQSVWVYNKKDELQTKYFLLYNEEPISYTKGEKAALVMKRLDLKDHPIIQLKFEDDKKEKIYNVEYRKE